MIICTKCGQANGRDDTFCGRCGAFLEWTGQAAAAPDAPRAVTPTPGPPPRRVLPEPQAAERAVVATLSATTVKVEPGGQAVLGVEVRNRGRTVDRLTLEVLGPAAAWSAVDPPTLNLLPDMAAKATVTFGPPRSPGVPAGSVPFGLGVRSRERPDASVIERGVAEVAPFVEYETSLAPSILRGGRSATARATASNRGNAPISLSLSADDPEMALAFRLTPAALRVEPGASAEASVQVRPRRAFRSGSPRARPFRVLVTAEDGARRGLDGTFVQIAARPRWWLAALGLLALAVVGVVIANPFSAIDLGGFLPTDGAQTPAPPSAQPPGETAQPQPTERPGEPGTPSPSLAASQPSAIVSPVPSPSPVLSPQPGSPSPQPVNHVPLATIEAPSDGAVFEYDPATCLESTPQVCAALVPLIATIRDPEEGLLQGDGVLWTTVPTVDGFTLDKSTLGRGAILGGVPLQTYRCKVSTHLIAVTARDFEGAEASASVTVAVGPGPADVAVCP